MDTGINHTELFDLSGRTTVHKSTQTDTYATSSGFLGPYEVSRVDEVVTFTGCLSDNKISLEKGRVVVKILPALNFTSQDEGDSSKSFSIRFQSLPTNQASVNATEESDGEVFTPDSRDEWITLYDDASISGNTVPGVQISRDSGVDSHSVVHFPSVTGQPVLAGMSEDSVSLDTSVSEGSFSGSALTGTTSSPDRASSLDRKSYYSLNSNSSPLDSATDSLIATCQEIRLITTDQKICPFTNGQIICEIAEKIRDSRPCNDPVSRVITSNLITYDPDKAPDWYINKYEFQQSLRDYIEIFMLKSFARLMGCHAKGNRINIFAGSGNRLSPKFIFWIEHDSSAFEWISEASQMLASFKRDIDQCFRWGTKTFISRLELYESLSFKESDKATFKSINQKAESPLPSDCYPGIIFYFRHLMSKLEETIKTEKCSAGKREIARKIADYKISQKQRGNFDLLNACANYNVAVDLIEKEYKSTGLSQYDSKRRTLNVLSAEDNYSLVAPGELDVIRQLLFLIEALEEEGRGIISEYETSIDALPRALQGRSFEERVLHMFDNGNGYVSRPLKSIKSTLNNVLANHPENLKGSPD
ncbi:hypothetical protein [Endozoicomonas sp. YOMI1]|uniref:hypothetical protein n=1 Tax=Endozoicomonas sp. YOMI1 TaxID=2828739 RepID=UPI002148E55A|nr:hypothetical protein [Endozoicomonas sp. YOMI1]